MSYVVKTTNTKPVGVQWFGQAHSEAKLRLNQWVLAQPGVLSAINGITDPNTQTAITVFEDEAAYQNFLAAKQNNADAQALAAYALANNFTTTVEILG